MAISAAQFPDYYNTTRSDTLSPENFIPNLAQRVNYPIGVLMKGQTPFSATKPGGESLIETIQLDHLGTFGTYSPMAAASIQRRGTTKQYTWPWALYRSVKMWSDHEFNTNTGAGTDKARIKNFGQTLRQAAKTDHLNGMDFICFAVPNYDTMEGTPPNSGDRVAYSIMAYVSEDATRYRPPSSVWNSANVNGVDVTTGLGATNVNRIRNYTAADILSNTGAGLLPAWDLLMLDLSYAAAARSDGTGFITTGPNDLVCFTNTDGMATMSKISRINQDRWKNPQDGAFPNPTFDGIEFVHAPQLNSALLSQTGSTYDGTAYATGQPRYIVINKRTTRPVFLAGENMNEHPAARADAATFPDTTVQWTTSTLNIVCNDRTKNGIIAPTTA